MTTPETAERLANLRERVLNNEEVPPEEYAEIIESIREERRSAAKSSGGRGKKAAAPSNLPADLNDLFKPQTTE